MSSLWILGAMTGTSCDGLDAALIQFDVTGWRPGKTFSLPYPVALKKRVLAFQKPGSRWGTEESLALNRDLGIWYADCFAEILAKLPEEERPSVIANHGQTVAHFPQLGKRNPLRPKLGTTWQLGDPAIIAARTGLTVVSHFRNGDLAAEGQGAPLVPAYHRILAEQLSHTLSGVALHNIGGISNLSFFTGDGTTVSFDTGPGNIWIDAAAQLATRGKQKMDTSGKLASQGEVDVQALNRILKNPYFKLPPPKSTGRDQFPATLLTRATRSKGADLVATATAVTIESIARAYEALQKSQRTRLREIWVCGGGAKNPTLLEGLSRRLEGVPVKSVAEQGWDPQAIESQAFAFFGFLSLLGRPISGPWTGARTSFVVPGWIVPGANWREVWHLIQDLGSHAR